MSTNIFQTETGQLLNRTFPICERFDDAFKNRFGDFRVSKKPYDFFGATKTGKYWGAEAKKVIVGRFPIRNLEEHQRKALSKLEDNNALAFLFINWRVKRAGETIWIPFEAYCEVEYRVLSKGRKSVTPNDFDEDWFLVRGTGLWTIPPNHNLYHLI